MKLLCNNTGIWEIFREIDERSGEAFIFRFPKNESSLKSFVKNWHIVKDLELPTLSKVEPITRDNREGIKTEDVNYGKPLLFVSYNSIPTREEREVELIDSWFFAKNANKTVSEYEEYRYNNPLQEILMFRDFLSLIERKLKIVSEHRVMIDFDAYFFGTTRESKVSPISFKIIDLDFIRYNDSEDDILSIIQYNLSEFARAMIGFLKVFVSVEHQAKYIDEVNLYIPS